MSVKIVTDSTSDLSPEVAKEFGISVVPLMVRFGDETYQDGIDLSADQFYQKLVQGPMLPTTAAPAPGAFSEVYRKLLKEGHEILSIHISSKLSGTYDSAVLGKEQAGDGAIEIVDSLSVSMGIGLLTVVAARAAKEGSSLADVATMVRKKMDELHLLGALDTLEYLHKGGRLGKAQALLGSLLNFKPLITVRGEVQPIGRVRTRVKAVNRLYELAHDFGHIDEMAVVHSTTPEDMEALADRMAPLVPEKKIFRARFGPVLGTYTGPGILAVAFLGGK